MRLSRPDLAVLNNLIEASRVSDAPVLVVAHDSGSAWHLAHWLSELTLNYSFCLSGPALTIFSQFFPELICCQLTPHIVSASSIVISGTGWQSSFEHLSRLYCQRQNIINISVLDHWVNYDEAFTYQNQLLLPNHILVSDEYAQALALQQFPGVSVTHLPNLWLKRTVSEISQKRRNDPLSPAQSLLYLSEPLRTEWPNSSQSPEQQSIQFLIDHIYDLICLGFVSEDPVITLRPHPSERSDKYLSIISSLKYEQEMVRIELNHDKSLIEALSTADAAFGCHTQALVVALESSIPTFCTLPPWAPPCTLPHEGIIKLASLVFI